MGLLYPRYEAGSTLKSTACVFYSPLVILDETVENNVAVPAGLTEILACL